VIRDFLARAPKWRLRLRSLQARLRRWYDEEQKKPETADLSPQEIQRRFPQYDAMVADISVVNAGLIGFAESLRRIAHDRQKTPWWHLLPSKKPQQAKPEE
jgi:hypothetical protein